MDGLKYVVLYPVVCVCLLQRLRDIYSLVCVSSYFRGRRGKKKEKNEGLRSSVVEDGILIRTFIHEAVDYFPYVDVIHYIIIYE